MVSHIGHTLNTCVASQPLQIMQLEETRRRGLHSLSKPSMRTATGWLLSGLSKSQQPSKSAGAQCWKHVLKASNVFFIPAGSAAANLSLGLLLHNQLIMIPMTFAFAMSANSSWTPNLPVKQTCTKSQCFSSTVLVCKKRFCECTSVSRICSHGWDDY